MKRLIWIFAAMLGFQGLALAQGVYTELACRSNDPFVFCTQGCKGADKNWIPLSPQTGTWLPAPVPGTYGYCPTPNTGTCPENVYPYVIFLPWTQTGVRAVYQYMEICPAGGGSASDWKGSDRPENVPNDH